MSIKTSFQKILYNRFLYSWVGGFNLGALAGLCVPYTVPLLFVAIILSAIKSLLLQHLSFSGKVTLPWILGYVTFECLTLVAIFALAFPLPFAVFAIIISINSFFLMASARGIKNLYIYSEITKELTK